MNRFGFWIFDFGLAPRSSGRFFVGRVLSWPRFLALDIQCNYDKAVDEYRDCNYIVIMKTNIVAIGNSQGVRIPKILLDQSGLSGEVDLEVCEHGILIKKSRSPRHDWDEAFRQMAANNDDELVLEESVSPAKEKWRW